MSGDPFTMRVRIPTGTPADVRMRVGLALVETAIDRILAAQMRVFEESLVENNAPLEHVPDLLLWTYEYLQEWRAETLAEARTWPWGWEDAETIQ